MRSGRLNLRGTLQLVALLAIPVSVTAVPVDVTYTITGGESSQLGNVPGNPGIPTGGTATVRWSLSSLNGSFLLGSPATVLNLTFQTTGGGTFAGLFDHLQGLPQVTIGGHCCGMITGNTLAQATGVRHYLTTYGSFGAVIQTAFTGTRYRLLVFGHEVSRSLATVPTPTAAPLLAVGLAGLMAAGAAGRWRRRHP